MCRYPPVERDPDGCRGQHQDPKHGHPLQARHHTQADAGPQAQVKYLNIMVVRYLGMSANKIAKISMFLDGKQLGTWYQVSACTGTT